MTRAAEYDRIGHVSLRVRDLNRSVDFYQNVLGLLPREAEPPSAKVRVCAQVHDGVPCGIDVVLTEGLPAGLELAGLDHFSLVVPTRRNVDDAYYRATQAGVQATQPRTYAGHYQTFIFDPDGYKIEIRTSRTIASDACGESTT